MSLPHAKLAGALLVTGWVVFWAGACTPPYRWWMGAPVREYLQLVNTHVLVWRWIAVSFAIGVLSTAAGLVVLREGLRAGGPWADLGVAAFLFGAVGWIASIAFRATVTVSAARELDATGTVPGWFEPLRAWTGAVFALYMVLAYASIALHGKAMLEAGLVPRWLGWTHLVFGLAGTVGYVARVPLFDPPLMIHLVPGIAGAWLLLRGGSP
jgi:hypothetical protein